MDSPWSLIHKFLSHQTKTFLILLAVCLVLSIGYFDYMTGFEASVSFLYLIPVAMVTWYIGERAGYLLTFLSILTWTLSNWAAGETYSHESVRYWNVFTRTLVSVVAILLVQEFKRALSHQRMLSQTDFLTGIANSREFYLQATAELERAGRSKRQISVAYIDLDGFKQVNDRFGHREGDRLLRTVAQSIQSAIRKTDLIARLGGDEFAILLPNTDLDGAKCIMDRVCQTFQSQMDQLNVDVTLSAGVVSFSSHPSSVDEMLQRTDQLMYAAKTAGKNGVLFTETD